MARKNAKRFAHYGQFSGIDELTSRDLLQPGQLSKAFNMEVYGGKIRPRRGLKELPILSTNSIGDRLATIHAIPDEGGNGPDTLLLQSIGSIESKLYRYDPLADDQLKAISDVGAAQFNFSLGQEAEYADAGGWTLMAASKDSLSRAASISLDLTNLKLYWTDNLLGTLSRSDLDGTNAEILLEHLDGVTDLDIDPAGGKVYFCERRKGAIVRCDLDGENYKVLFDSDDGLEFPVSIDHDHTSNEVFWVDNGTQKIQKGAEDGSGSVTDLVTTTGAQELVIDVANDDIYFSSLVGGSFAIRKYDSHAAAGTVTQHITLTNPTTQLIGELELDTTNNRIYFSVGGLGVFRTADMSAESAQTKVFDKDDRVNPNDGHVSALAIDAPNSMLYWGGRQPQGRIKRATIATPIKEEDESVLIESTPVMAYASVNRVDILRLAGLAAPIKSFGFNAASEISDSTNTPANVIADVGTIFGYKFTYYDTTSGLESDPSAELVAEALGTVAEDTHSMLIHWSVPATWYGHNSGTKLDLFADKIRIYRRVISTNQEFDWSFVDEVDIDAGAEKTASQNELTNNTLSMEVDGTDHSAANFATGMVSKTVVITSPGSSTVAAGQTRTITQYDHSAGATPRLITVNAAWKTPAGANTVIKNDTKYKIIGSYEDFKDATEINKSRPVPKDHGVPPPSAFIEEFKGRVFYVPPNGRTVYYSLPFQQGDGRSGAEYVPAYNFDVLPSGGNITAIKAFGEQLMIFTEEEVYTIDISVIDDEGLAFIKIRNAAGCINNRTIAVSSAKTGSMSVLYYASASGVYIFDGVNATMISAIIADTWARVSESTWKHDINMSNATAIFDPNYRRYILFYVLRLDEDTLSVDKETPNRNALVWDQDSQTWMNWGFGKGVVGPEAFEHGTLSLAVFRDTEGEIQLLGGTTDRRLTKFSRPKEEYFDDNGGQISWFFKLPELSFGDQSSKKKIRDINSSWRVDDHPDLDGAFSHVSIGLKPVIDNLITPRLEKKFFVIAKAPVDEDGGLINPPPVNHPDYVGVEDTPYYVGAEAKSISLEFSGNDSHPISLLGYMINFTDKGLRG